VLATSIAESSLTIEGVRVVIDTGLARIPQYSSRNGLTKLVTRQIPLDRITQRTGRAGRTCPGVCYRLWTQAEELTFTKISKPEILSADLSQTALLCAEWGTRELAWLTPPPPSAWTTAWQCLKTLGAVNADLQITPLGHQMTRFPVHPSLAAMMLKMQEIDKAGGALLAAICAEGERITSLRTQQDFRRVLATVLDERPREIWQLATRWAGGSPTPRLSIDALVPYLLWAFPGHLAKRRNTASGRYLLAAGFGAVPPADSLMINAEWLFAVRMSDGDAEATIRWCFPLTESDLSLLQAETRTRIEWDKNAKRLIAAEAVCYGEIVTKSRPLKSIPPELQIEAERCQLRHEGLPWTPAAERLAERIAFLRKTLPDAHFPALEKEALIEALAQCPGLSLQSAILNLLSASGHSQQTLDREAPTHFRVPSGSNMTIHYDLDQPYVAVKIQEVFGLKATPRIAQGTVPILLHLLSPAQRPVQVTSDLASFWQNGYAIVRKDLRGRYPKHYWPEDPTQAEPSRRTLKPKPSP
jgi:ATP-dependent helicase HrpB